MNHCSSDAIPMLMLLARSEDPSVRSMAVYTIWCSVPVDSAATNIFVEALQSKDRETRLLALKAINGVMERWQKGQVDQDIDLSKRPPNGEAAKTKNLVDEAGARSEWSPIVAVLPALIQRTGEEDAEVRVSAVRGLAQPGPIARDALPELLAAMHDQSPFVRDNAARALWHFPNECEDVLEELVQLARDQANREYIGEQTAITTLTRMGPRAAKAIPALVEMLGDKNPINRLAGARALGSVGPEAKLAAGELTKLLEDPLVRQEAATALGNLGPEEANLALSVLIRTDPQGRYEATTFVLGTAPEVREALCPILRSLVKDQSLIVRARASVLLSVVDRKSESFACAALKEIFQQGTSEERKIAAGEIENVNFRREAGAQIVRLLAEFEARK